MTDTISWIRLVPGLLAAAVGVAAMAGWQLRARTRLAAPAIGAATWAVSVALKLAWALPTNAAVHRALPEPLFWIYVGSLTGIFEVGATFAVVRFTRLRFAGRRDALAFGVGFGAVEAVVIGLIGTVSVVLARSGGPVGIIEVLSPPIERASTLVFHVVTCALVVHGFRAGRPWRWFGAAFAYKSAVDAVAAWAILSLGVTRSDAKLAAVEAGLAAFAVASAWGLHHVLREDRDALAGPVSSTA